MKQETANTDSRYHADHRNDTRVVRLPAHRDTPDQPRCKDKPDIGEGVDWFRPEARAYSFTIKIHHWTLINPHIGFKGHSTHYSV